MIKSTPIRSSKFILGDSIKELEKLQDQSIDMAFCDPPYNLQLSKALYRPDMSKVSGVRDDWDKMAAATPIGRNGSDKEVGDFCAYLCTEAASWIHGQSINQNGGSVMEH